MPRAAALQHAQPPRAAQIPQERLESCIRRLDPADRALLDLSLNRAIPDAQMAPILRADPLRLAWRRARAIERVASRLGLTHPADLPEVRAALARLPNHAWLPLELQAAPAPKVLERETRASPPAPAVRHAVGSSLGGLPERAKRAYPRGTIRRRARQTAGAALVSLAALALRKRR